MYNQISLQTKKRIALMLQMSSLKRPDQTNVHTDPTTNRIQSGTYAAGLMYEIGYFVFSSNSECAISITSIKILNDIAQHTSLDL